MAVSKPSLLLPPVTIATCGAGSAGRSVWSPCPDESVNIAERSGAQPRARSALTPKMMGTATPCHQAARGRAAARLPSVHSRGCATRTSAVYTQHAPTPPHPPSHTQLHTPCMQLATTLGSAQLGLSTASLLLRGSSSRYQLLGSARNSMLERCRPCCSVMRRVVPSPTSGLTISQPGSAACSPSWSSPGSSCPSP